jgi:hypothetical protein
VGKLRIYLEEGFLNDSVVIIVNNTEIYQKQAVTTHRVLGLADSVSIDISEEGLNIEVIFRNRSISKSIFLNNYNTLSLAVSIKENEIIYRTSKKPFAYR